MPHAQDDMIIGADVLGDGEGGGPGVADETALCPGGPSVGGEAVAPERDVGLPEEDAPKGRRKHAKGREA